MAVKRQARRRGLTSLQRVLRHRQAEHSQARAGVRCHLDLVLRPDDQLGHQAVVDLRAADVLVLVLPGEARQAIPAVEESMAKRLVTMISFQVNASLPAIPQPVIRGTLGPVLFSSESLQSEKSTKTVTPTKEKAFLHYCLLSDHGIYPPAMATCFLLIS